MEMIITTIEITNASDLLLAEQGYLAESEVRRHSMESRVDTGSIMLTLPQDIVKHLGLKTLRPVSVDCAEDRVIAGPLLLRVAGREMFTDCLVNTTGTEALIGRIVLTQLDLIADCQKQALYPRPESPIYPLLNLK